MKWQVRTLLWVVLVSLLHTVPAGAGENRRLQGFGWSLYDGYQGLYPDYLPVAPGLAESPAGEFQTDGYGIRHLWQDPQDALVNAINTYLSARDRGPAQQLGAGGEMYYGSLTAAGKAGYLEDSFSRQSFAGVDLRWYARENLSLQVGWEQMNDYTLGNLRLEYAPQADILNGLSFFAGASGDSGLDNHYFIGGFRYFFGSPGSLLQRDRQDPGAARDRLSPYFRSLWIEP